MKNPFVHYLRLQERFVFQTRVQAVALVMGGVILSILDLVGVTAIFPLMLVILDPEMATKGVILGAIYNGFGFKSISAFATFLASTVIILFGIKVIFNLILWRYEFSLLNKWQIKISSTIFDLMLYTDFKNINSQSSGSFINILTSVVPYITRNYIHQCIALMQTAILAALIISYMLYVNYMLFLFVCISSSLLIFIFMSLQRNHMRVLGKKGQDLARDLLEVLQQSIAGFKETKIHQKEGYFYDKFTGTSKKSAKTDLSLLFAQNLPNVLIEYIVITIVFGVFALMLLVSEALQSSAVQISVIVLLGLRVTPLINRTITSLALINSALGPIDQLLEIEETLRSGNLPEKEKEEEKRGQGCIIDFNESICLENVSFKYDDTQNACLKDINLIINKNEHIGIVGASGSGKTTLVNIILGFLTDYDGKYTIDGKEIRGEFIYGMRRITSFVDQQPFLLDGDYIANIAYGVEKIDVDKERVIKCLKDVGLWDHVQSASDGLSTNIGENGKYLSGGQRQRLVIARALYRGSKILILDEASSALDMKSEALITSLIESLRNEITVISIAHRLSTLKKCDTIIFMDNGQIVSRGTFKELYDKNEEFRKYVDYSMIDVT